MVRWTDMGHSHMRQTFLLGPEESTWNMGALSSEDPNSVVNMTEKHSLKRCGAEFQGKPREVSCMFNDPSNQPILKLCTVSFKTATLTTNTTNCAFKAITAFHQQKTRDRVRRCMVPTAQTPPISRISTNPST